MSSDPFVQFKAVQRDGWGLFAPVEMLTTTAAGHLVNYAGVRAGAKVLDVACGTGVVAITAARIGAVVSGLDLSPVLLERAKHNATLSELPIEFTEGDAEALPHADATFDVVLSQFGHMFAPRPDVAVKEMLRVLKPGGRIAFSTWPPELFTGHMFTLVAKYMPSPPADAPKPAPPAAWGEPSVVRERLGNAVTSVEFMREEMRAPMMSVRHSRHFFETTVGPIAKLIAVAPPEKVSQFRAEFEQAMADYFDPIANVLRQHFLMTRALKRA
ncbi:MAG: class I SAM-dependent methyltransferase [Gemmatimonadaceae bacterium]